MYSPLLSIVEIQFHYVLFVVNYIGYFVKVSKLKYLMIFHVVQIKIVLFIVFSVSR